MSIHDFSQIKDVWGEWCTIASSAGLFSGLLSFLSRHPRLLSAEDGDGVGVIEALPWLMGLLAFLIGLLVLPLSMSYSGPVPWEIRDLRRYDIRFAALIAFAFGFVLAFDTLRFPKLRRRAVTWLCIGTYVVVACALVIGMLSHRNEPAA
jgi:hypothetical protein